MSQERYNTIRFHGVMAAVVWFVLLLFGPLHALSQNCGDGGCGPGG